MNYAIRNLFPLDLKPYGIQLVLTNNTTLKDIRTATLQSSTQTRIPTAYDSEEFQSLLLFDKYTIQVGSDIYIEEDFVAGGSGGSVYKCRSSSGEPVALKRIPNIGRIRQSDVIIECVLQILLYEATKGFPGGAYVPKVSAISQGGFVRDRSMTYPAWYIFTEWMDGTLMSECEKKPAAETEPILLEAFQQLLPMLTWLESIHFNHRDFACVNLMFKVIGGTRRYKLIDFGASCLEIPLINGTMMPLAVSVYFRYQSCFKPGRDLMHLLWDVTNRIALTPALQTVCMNQVKLELKGVNKSNQLKALTFNRHTILNSSNYTYPNLNISQFETDLRHAYALPVFPAPPEEEEAMIPDAPPGCFGRLCKRITNAFTYTAKNNKRQQRKTRRRRV
jgi:serine/threonine protein kinase